MFCRHLVLGTQCYIFPISFPCISFYLFFPDTGSDLQALSEKTVNKSFAEVVKAKRMTEKNHTKYYVKKSYKIDNLTDNNVAKF
jgi:hypothetical protein